MTSLTRLYFQSQFYKQKQNDDIKAVVSKLIDLKRYVSTHSIPQAALTQDNKGNLRKTLYERELTPELAKSLGSQEFAFVSNYVQFISGSLSDMMHLRDVFPDHLAKELIRLSDGDMVVTPKRTDEYGCIAGQLEFKGFFENDGVQSSLIISF